MGGAWPLQTRIRILPGTDHRAAIVGAGPAGFYTADQLLKQGFEVDLYDELPTPFGLVRSGVAPDHPNIKAVTRVYEKTARKEGFRFFGGVAPGRAHHAPGPARALRRRRLRVRHRRRQPPRHPRRGPPRLALGHPLRRLVQRPPARRRRRVRPLVRARGGDRQRQRRDRRRADARPRPRGALAHRHRRPRDRGASARRRSSEVELLGRRGPAQAAFTNPELRELGELKRADLAVEHHDMRPRRLQRALAGRGGRRDGRSATSTSCAPTPSAATAA